MYGQLCRAETQDVSQIHNPPCHSHIAVSDVHEKLLLGRAIHRVKSAHITLICM